MEGELLAAAQVLHTYCPESNYLSAFIGALKTLESNFKQGNITGMEFISINLVEGAHLLNYAETLWS